MIQSRTVFVVGAGASREAGLPTGAELKRVIAEKMNFIFDSKSDGLKSGDRNVYDALMVYANAERRYWPEVMRHVQWISDAMPQAISIDNFLDAHRTNSELELCGKLGIAQAILEAEANSLLKFDPMRRQRFEPRKLSDTWYEKFFMLLSEGVRADNLESLFSNISFIVFNYDRCVEYFLYHSICTYFGLSEEDAAALVNTVNISHPYGTVGKLSWQGTSTNTSFGVIPSPQHLLEITSQIKTFTERVEDEPTRNAMRQKVQEADTLVFLGFAFHPLNLELIGPEEKSVARRLFATRLGISESDLRVIDSDVKRTLKRTSMHSGLRYSSTCTELFSEFWHTLARGG
jgi:hypothetical protein